MHRFWSEWPTLAVAFACYGGWAAALTMAGSFPAFFWAPILIVAITWHSSLQHEALHGHPFVSPLANEALVFPALGLFVPYRRFRTLHLSHHRDPNLTDPYDDPESFYLDPARWQNMAWPLQRLLAVNNTLAGRLVLGPAIVLAVFWHRDAAAIAKADRRVTAAWLIHLAALAPVITVIVLSAVPFWACAACAYAGMGLLMLRTFLEHQAHCLARCRTVVIEDRGPLALLFLNNNFHVVHHVHP
ncbi:MAG TPA: fatty acid desaturase, partial [Afifellaceae bacterium]|nr:fatty acid desaturase [Afifellaceae bacterium]